MKEVRVYIYYVVDYTYGGQHTQTAQGNYKNLSVQNSSNIDQVKWRGFLAGLQWINTGSPQVVLPAGATNVNYRRLLSSVKDVVVVGDNTRQR